MDLIGGAKLLRIEALRFRAGSGFDPRRLLSLRSRGVDLISRANLRAYSLSFVSHGDLRLGLFGPVPVGAWVPYPGAHVRLTARRSQFFSGPQQPQLIESYPGNLGFAGKKEAPIKPQVYPVGDFLGPDLVLWSEDPWVRIPSSPFAKPAGEGVITALLIRRSTFSTRVGAVPIGPLELVDMRLDGVGPRSRTPVYDADLGPGQVTVTVAKPLAREPYVELRRRIRTDPWTWVKTIQSIEVVDAGPLERGPFPRRINEQERYPPLPRYAGLNVFGPMRKVAFHGVSGDLQIADESMRLGGSANVDLGDVRGFRNGENAQLVSAPLATSREAAELEFRAVGTASVNGVQQSTVSSHFERTLAGIGLVVTLCAGALTIVARVRGWKTDSAPE